MLLGVQYALRHGLRLIVYPRPDRTRVEQAVREMERECQESAKAFRYVAQHASQGEALPEMSAVEQMALKDMASTFRRAYAEARAEFSQSRFMTALQRLISGVPRSALDAIVKEVSAVVPAEVVQAVGDRNLTVLTAGMPYSFVWRNGADWREKAIGHVTGDRSILLLNDQFPNQKTAPTAIDVLFDPVLMETEETIFILNALQGRASYCLLLDGTSANSSSLLRLCARLPVELLYFNTHGADGSILLSDGPMPSHLLQQWLQLGSRPVVFNNSCLSWVGVGTDFLRAGAKGYIGTLWSVDQEHAAQFARFTVGRMVRDREPCSHALHGSGVDASTARAYLFVGTARAGLHTLRSGTVTSREQARIQAEQFLAVATWMLSDWHHLPPGDPRIATSKS